MLSYTKRMFATGLALAGKASRRTLDEPPLTGSASSLACPAPQEPHGGRACGGERVREVG